MTKNRTIGALGFLALVSLVLVVTSAPASTGKPSGHPDILSDYGLHIKAAGAKGTRLSMGMNIEGGFAQYPELLENTILPEVVTTVSFVPKGNWISSYKSYVSPSIFPKDAPLRHVGFVKGHLTYDVKRLHPPYAAGLVILIKKLPKSGKLTVSIETKILGIKHAPVQRDHVTIPAT